MLELYFDRVEEATAVMREVAQWGRQQGFHVWLDEWLTPEELITEDAQPENFCIGILDGKVACAFILQWKDSVYWKNSQPNEAAYLHKLCVRREFAHRGMTQQIVDAIRCECVKLGLRFIRLDTALDEKVIRKLYLNVGFKIVDIIDYDNERSMALYELEV